MFPDLMRAGNLTLTEHEREGLKASIKEDENSAAIEYAESMLAVSNPANLESIWKGYQSIPKQYGNDGFEIIFQSINGSIRSPRYGMEYHENDYKADKFIHIILDLSPVLHLIGNGMLVVNLELDTRQLEGWHESLEYTIGPRYKLHRQPKTWFEAQDYCKRHGEQLASILSDKELYEFESFSIDRRIYDVEKGFTMLNHVWIGAKRDGENGDFKWTDGSKVNTELKDIDERLGGSSSTCIGVKSNYGWAQKSCMEKRYFVCKSMPDILMGKKNLVLQFQKTKLYDTD